MPAAKRLFIGLMSGTSLDGIDCAIVDLAGGTPALIAAHCHALPDNLRHDVLTLCANKQAPFTELGRLDIELGRCFADAVAKTLAAAGIVAQEIEAIGSHGQTAFHQPNSAAPFSLQIGDPNTIAERTGITTVADFRRRDMAAGGQGAPLAPLLHQHCCASPTKNRAIVNIGGIANITLLLANGERVAFDTGPGNVLMDLWIAQHDGARFDKNGEWATGGSVDTAFLAELMSEPYLALAAPKSTGRELFNGAWLEQRLASLKQWPSPQNIQATLLEFTATTLSTALLAGMRQGEIYLCGGGAHNTALLKRIGKLMPGYYVGTTAEIGIDPDWLEAMAFAWMAQQTLDGVAVVTTPFTGAKKPVMLGGIYPSPTSAS
jgi:anhydro-N-acetylmuramic acid kinase